MSIGLGKEGCLANAENSAQAPCPQSAFKIRVTLLVAFRSKYLFCFGLKPAQPKELQSFGYGLTVSLPTIPATRNLASVAAIS